MTRRSVFQVCGAGAAMTRLGAAQAPGTKVLGKVRPRASRDVKASGLGIGFETVDRGMWEPEKAYPHLAELGVKWARVQTAWFRCERRKGEFDFSFVEKQVDSLLQIGIQPWFSVCFGNTLYTPGPAHESAVGWPPVYTGEARNAWTRYVGKLAELFRNRVRHWEVWNEADMNDWWRPNKSDPAEYMGLVKMTAAAVRRHIPHAVMIGCALAGTPGNIGFVEGCLELGLANLVEKITYHPYRALPEWNYEADIRGLRGLVARYSSRVALWQGENGAPSSNDQATGALSSLKWSEPAQARWLLRRILTDLWLEIEMTSYFNTSDMSNYIWASGKTALTNYKGVLRKGDYSRKPSYYAYQNVCALFDSDTRKAGLLIRVERTGSMTRDMEIRTATFERKGRPIYAFWYPSNLQEGYTPGQARIHVWSGKHAPMEKPVLVDLLTGEITEPPAVTQNKGFWVFDGLTVQDYPVLITDRSVVA